MARNRGPSLAALFVAVSIVVGGELRGEGAWDDSIPELTGHLGNTIVPCAFASQLAAHHYRHCNE